MSVAESATNRVQDAARAAADWVVRLDRGTKVVGGLGTLFLVAFLAAFTLGNTLAWVPLVGFVAANAFGAFRYPGATARYLAFVATACTVLVLGLIMVYLFLRSREAFGLMSHHVSLFGVSFDVPGLRMFTDTSSPFWTPSQQLYALAPMLWGTFVTTLIATAVAGPLGVAGALFISEMAPGWAREILKPSVETLAGIPSIVYGFIGFIVLSGFMMDEFSLPTFGSLVVVGFVIGVMALPTVVSVAEDAIASVPGEMKDGSLALGATSWQTTTSVTLPASLSGVSAAILLGVGRAVGETMAATVILANLTELPDPLYDVFGSTITLTSLIASQYGIATGSQMSALFAAGVVLFVTVLALSIGSQYIEARMNRKLGGQE
ncbi:phosphate ABC transporter permease subunit PstC [Salarchaeum japonicum]|uniref:Phosphate transport system permease protein n=1 Tax=Salarchaeum japonicum TaxID=555573 RepID=A0AAV3T4A4_9EURY|nr:phosphate ABC transporter permease subunit PstC [Salarchaeum japonicum]